MWKLSNEAKASLLGAIVGGLIAGIISIALHTLQIEKEETRRTQDRLNKAYTTIMEKYGSYFYAYETARVNGNASYWVKYIGATSIFKSESKHCSANRLKVMSDALNAIDVTNGGNDAKVSFCKIYSEQMSRIVPTIEWELENPSHKSESHCEDVDEKIPGQFENSYSAFKDSCK